MTATTYRRALAAALRWHIDAGADEALAATPPGIRAAKQTAATARAGEPAAAGPLPSEPQSRPAAAALEGTAALAAQAAALARAAGNTEDLRGAIAAFGGLPLRDTATNLVFCDGNPRASVMLVGEASDTDEDRIGRPFVGASGQLLDRILASIGIGRAEEDPAQSVYISNILNWRPPGNRTPTPAEIEISLPFIARHIALIQPKILIFCGAISAKALLNTNESISKLRGTWHEYRPQGEGGEMPPIPAIVTYHPAYLLHTPAQKRAVWQDMLRLQEKRRALGLIQP